MSNHKSKFAGLSGSSDWNEILNRLNDLSGTDIPDIIGDLTTIENTHPDCSIYNIVYSYFLNKGNIMRSVLHINSLSKSENIKSEGSVQDELALLLKKIPGWI